MPTLFSVLPLYRQNLCSSFGGCRRGAYGPMAYKRENFRLSGPLHLTAVDWKNPHDRRSVAASLVRGVYVLERDRQQKRRGLRALAPTWWDFFHFKLVHVLVDNADLSIFGAVYEFKFPPSECNCSDQTLLAPTYVVAFRGLIPTPDIMSQDFNLYFHFIQNRLQQNSRFQLAMQSVQNVAVLAGAANIWLTGHSMGSAIALLAGKNMGKAGYLIDTYLFNPPFISAAPTERIEDQNLKHGIRFISSVITAGIAVAVNGLHQRSQKENSFAVLSGWTPYLFVNPSDPICSEYIGYFQHREKMVEVGAGEIARLATQISIESLLSGLEASHLLPSAYLTTNLSTVQDFRQAHGIQQWWQPNIRCQFKLYQFN